MRKLLCTLLSALVLSGSASALAANDISVSVDRRTVHFADQQPVIVNDRTLVPARGVFEALGARVLWDAEERKVTIFSKDNLSRIILYIDSTDFKQVTFKSLLSYDVKDFTSEVAPQIINGRTMIPLYLVADYMSNKAEWNGQERSVTVTSKERLRLLENITPTENMTAEETFNSTLPKMSISVDKTDVKTGDEITVKVNISNIGENSGKYFGSAAAVKYDRNNFEFKSLNYTFDSENSAKAHNPDYMSDSVKYLYYHDAANLPRFANGTVAEIVFVAKNDIGGTFSLSDRVTDTDYDTNLTLVAENEPKVLQTAAELYIDTTPIVVK